MNYAQIAALLFFLAAAGHSAELKGLPELPGAKSILEKMVKPASVKRPAASADLTATEHVFINIYNYSDGSFNVSESASRLDLRAYKPFANEFNYRLSGWAANRSVSGEARTRHSQDPSFGYWLSGSGYSANLDKFGSGWTMNGIADGKNFHYTISRNFTDSYSVFTSGLDVRIETRAMSSTVSGWYDKTQVGPTQLAILGTVAGILSQPKLRQQP